MDDENIIINLYDLSTNQILLLLSMTISLKNYSMVQKITEFILTNHRIGSYMESMEKLQYDKGV